MNVASLLRRRFAPFAAVCLLALVSPPHGRGADVYSDEQKGWALGTCAVLTQVNKRSHDLLGGRPIDEKAAAATKRTLEDFWNVRSREDLLTVLLWIDRQGHRKDFEAAVALTPEQAETVKKRSEGNTEVANAFAVAREAGPALGAKSLVGWDFSRYVSLCGWGVVAGYLSEDEAWARIMPAARKLQQTFTSWDELGQNYLIGRRYWSLASTQRNGVDYENAMKWLNTDPASPWKKYPWNLNLTPKPGNAPDPKPSP